VHLESCRAQQLERESRRTEAAAEKWPCLGLAAAESTAAGALVCVCSRSRRGSVGHSGKAAKKLARRRFGRAAATCTAEKNNTLDPEEEQAFGRCSSRMTESLSGARQWRRS